MKNIKDISKKEYFIFDAFGTLFKTSEIKAALVTIAGEKTDNLIFFSSNQWDVSGASIFGLDACWINQYRETREGLPFGKVVETGSLKELTMHFLI